MDILRFKQQPVMGIVRGVSLQQAAPLAEAVINSGLQTLEITMNTEGAADILRAMRRSAQHHLMLGAGTVLNTESLKQALDAGATFIVLPCFIQEVVAFCVNNHIPVFPGALTPQEIFTCWSEGATMVKVFPARVFGPQYFKEIKGPFQDIELLACGGVTPGNMGEYFSCGASAIAVGASVFKKEWLQDENFSSITDSLKAYLSALRR